MNTAFKVIVQIACIGSVIAVAGCRKENPGTSETRPVAVRVINPIETTIEKKIPYMGTVHSKHEVTVTAQVQGTLSDVPFKEGQTVSKGDVIARLDAPDILAAVERFTVDRNYWKRRFEADQRLVVANALAAEQAEASLRALSTAQAALDEAQARASKIRETSPVSGIVLRWFAVPGQNVMPGQPIILLGDNDMEIHVEVVEEDIAQNIKTGLPVEVIDIDNNTTVSSVTEIAQIASGPSRTFTVTIPVDRHSPSIQMRGSSVRVNFVVGSGHGIVVPEEAVVQQGNESYIYLVRQNRAVLQQVTEGTSQDGYTLVSFPWNAEDQVATTNLNSLSDGHPVYSVQLGEVTP